MSDDDRQRLIPFLAIDRDDDGEDDIELIRVDDVEEIEQGEDVSDDIVDLESEADLRAWDAVSDAEVLDIARADLDAHSERFAAALVNVLQGERFHSDIASFSDMSLANAGALRESWLEIESSLRSWLIQAAGDLQVENPLYSFSRLFRLGSSDPDEAVRAHATAGMGIDVDRSNEAVLLQLLAADPSDDVRAQAATALNGYAFEASLEDVADPVRISGIVNALLNVAYDDQESWHVRRRAIESASQAGADDRLESLIEEMWDSGEVLLQASAVFAAGRAELAGWQPRFLAALRDSNPEIRMEAASSLGFSGNPEVVADLQLVALRERDHEARLAAVSAIGPIGGGAATRALRELLDSASASDQAAIREALDESLLIGDEYDLDVEPEDADDVLVGDAAGWFDLDDEA